MLFFIKENGKNTLTREMILRKQWNNENGFLQNDERTDQYKNVISYFLG
jgi:hypothetical protein